MFANMISAEDDAARVLAGVLEGVTEEAGPNVKVGWRPVANGSKKTSLHLRKN
jgi:hypothetical protein